MYLKILILCIAVSSLFGYLEWGGQGDHAFLFQVEIEFFSKLFTSPKTVLHPFTIIPLAGQLILIFALFQKQPNFWLVVAGVVALGILLLFMLFIGVSTENWKITISVLPFLILSLVLIIFKGRLFS